MYANSATSGWITATRTTKVGWGINTSTALNTWGRDQLKLQVAYGEGIGNYMNDGGVDIAPDSADLKQGQREGRAAVGY